MQMSNRGWLVVGLVLASLLTAFAIWRQSRSLDHGDVTYRPDYVLKDFHLVALNKQGQEAFTLDAPTLTRNPADESMDIQTPTFHFPDKQARRWRSVSKTAWVSAKGEVVKLRGDVVVDNPDPSQSQAKLESQAIDVDTKNNRATSEEAVTMSQPNTIIHATGLDADMNQDLVVLKSNVKATYVPKSAR